MKRGLAPQLFGQPRPAPIGANHQPGTYTLGPGLTGRMELPSLRVLFHAVHTGGLEILHTKLPCDSSHGRIEQAPFQVEGERIRYLWEIPARPFDHATGRDEDGFGRHGPIRPAQVRQPELSQERHRVRLDEVRAQLLVRLVGYRLLLEDSDPAHALNPLVRQIFDAGPPQTMQVFLFRYGGLFEQAALDCDINPDPALTPFRDRLNVDGDLFAIDPQALRRILNRAEREHLEATEKKVRELDVTHPGSPAHAMVLNDATNPTNPHVYIRGNPGRPGKEVPRRFLRALSPSGEAKPFTSGSGRLELAQAIASPDNPLTARVMVNRIWHHHFGFGLVATPSDFGVRGDLPTHPELLDFLARRFVESGWSVKAMHRLIMLSSTYQQKSDSRDDAFAADPRNQLLWKQNRQRLDYEALRDGVLATSGKLDTRMGGRPVELFEAKSFSTRRTVYGYVDRYDLDGTFRTFDFPSPDISNPMRSITTVPQQALFLMNSPFLLDQAKGLASRSDLPPIGEPEARINQLYLSLFGRAAEPREIDAARHFLEARAREEPGKGPTPWEEYAQVLLMTNEFTFID